MPELNAQLLGRTNPNLLGLVDCFVQRCGRSVRFGPAWLGGRASGRCHCGSVGSAYCYGWYLSGGGAVDVCGGRSAFIRDEPRGHHHGFGGNALPHGRSGNHNQTGTRLFVKAYLDGVVGGGDGSLHSVGHRFALQFW